MIYDSKENLDFYRGQGKNYETAVDFLQKTDLEAIEPGKYEVDGKEVYVNVTEYETKAWEDCKFETHEHYTDIQYVISGSEVMTYAPKKDLTVKTEYNPDKDVTFYTDDVRGIDMATPAGYYCIFNPQDGHKPKAMNGKPAMVKKVIVKIKED